MVLVKNINGTSDNFPPFGYNSWKDYWIAKKGYWPLKCAAYGCYDKAELGGHVMIVNGDTRQWFIVPICYAHNNSSNPYYVDETMLVLARDY